MDTFPEKKVSRQKCPGRKTCLKNQISGTYLLVSVKHDKKIGFIEICWFIVWTYSDFICSSERKKDKILEVVQGVLKVSSTF